MPTLNEIKNEVLADPANRLALSVYSFASRHDARELGLFEVQEYVPNIDPTTLTCELADDVARINRAFDILAHRTPIYGMSFHNLQCNLADYENEDLHGWATDREARDIVARLLAAVPELASRVAALEPVIPF